MAHQCLNAELIDGVMLGLATLPRGRFGLLDNLMRSSFELDAPPVVEGISVARRPHPGETTS